MAGSRVIQPNAGAVKAPELSPYYSSIYWLSSRFVGRQGKKDVTQYTHLQGTDLFVEKGKKLGGRVVCVGLDLLPSLRKKFQREQIWDQRRYAAWLHTLHHPFIRVDTHGAGMSHVPST